MMQTTDLKILHYAGGHQRPRSATDRTTREKINKGREEQHDGQDVRDTHRVLLHPVAAKCIFFSIAHGTFTKATFWVIKQASTNE